MCDFSRTSRHVLLSEPLKVKTGAGENRLMTSLTDIPDNINCLSKLFDKTNSYSYPSIMFFFMISFLV